MDGKGLVRQCTDIVTSYEMICIKTIWDSYDGDAGNTLKKA